MKLAGKIAIVTGTSPNIGGGIAEVLAADATSPTRRRSAMRSRARAKPSAGSISS